jgi:hypothetical protein
LQGSRAITNNGMREKMKALERSVMSITKNGVTSRLTRGKEEDIAKGKISKTPLSNWDKRLEVLENGHSVITKVRSRDEKGKGNTQPEHNKGWS